MKRSLRTIRNMLITLSLLLCISTSALWIMTAPHSRGACFPYRGVRYRVISEDGSLAIDNEPERWALQRRWEPLLREMAQAYLAYESKDRPQGNDVEREYFKAAGEFNWVSNQLSHFPQRHWKLPHVLILLVTSTLPLLKAASLIAAAYRTRRRHRAGLCPRCNYDLRGPLPRMRNGAAKVKA